MNTSRSKQTLLLLLASLACSASQSRAESMDELYDKAKLEQHVALYGAGPAGSHDRWIKEFQQKFPGVTVTFTGGLSNGLNQRIGASVEMEPEIHAPFSGRF